MAYNPKDWLIPFEDFRQERNRPDPSNHKDRLLPRKKRSKTRAPQKSCGCNVTRRKLTEVYSQHEPLTLNLTLSERVSIHAKDVRNATCRIHAYRIFKSVRNTLERRGVGLLTAYEKKPEPLFDTSNSNESMCFSSLRSVTSQDIIVTENFVAYHVKEVYSLCV